MTIISVKGFKIFRDRHGHWRCYHRKTGVPIDLKKTPIGSAEFIAECAKIAALQKAPEKEKPGTLGSLIAAYRASMAFRDLSAKTKRHYQAHFEYLRPEANRPWTDQERDAVLDGAPDHMRPAIALMMFAGLGPKDASTLPRTFAKGGQIATRRSKTGDAVFWPMPAPLADILDNAPDQIATTLCANSRGTPWTLSGFSASWRTLRIRFERKGFIGPGMTLYGLRHTVAVILRESGADERTIADALGQKSIEMARHYAKGADLSRKMRGVVKNFDAEVARRRTKTVKPSD